MSSSSVNNNFLKSNPSDLQKYQQNAPSLTENLSSISENNGIASLSEKDLLIYSVGISTAGSAEAKMALLHPQRHIIATTIDSEGVKCADSHIENLGLSKQIDIKIEDVAQPLPYPNQYFDFIYARLVLHYLPKDDLIQALSELNRILKDGGRLFVVVRSTNCHNALDIHSILDSQTGMTTYISNGKIYKRYFHTETSIQNYLISSGFEIQSCQTYNEQLCADFQRLQLATHIDPLIEVIAIKVCPHTYKR